MKPTQVVLILVSLFLFGFYVSQDSLNSTPAAGGPVLIGIPLGSNPRALAVDPWKDQAVVVCEKPHTVCVVDLTSEEVVATLPLPKAPRAVALDPGLGLALVSTVDDSVVVIDLEGNQIVKSLQAGRAPRAMWLLSPTRKTIR